MTYGEMDAVQIDDTVVLEQSALAPGLILLGQCLVQTTDGARAGSDSQQFFRHFSDTMGTGAADKHVRQRFRHLGFIACIALKHLCLKGPSPISGHLEILNAPGRGYQIAGVGPIAVATAHGRAFSPRGSDATRPVLPA